MTCKTPWKTPYKITSGIAYKTAPSIAPAALIRLVNLVLNKFI
jgi:hypothetical protein